MKKILCALTAAIMLAVQCAVYAETEAVNDNAADNDIQLTAVPTENITGENVFTQEETEKLKAAVSKAVEEAVPPEDITGQSIEITIPEDIEINVFDGSGSDNITPRAGAVMGIAQNFLADNPELFYLNNNIMYSYNEESYQLKSLSISWKYNAGEIKTIQSELDEVTDEIIIQMWKDGINLEAIMTGTDEEKKQAQFDAALWLHDYLADTITYDSRGYSTDPDELKGINRTIDAALLGGRVTVCEGYSNAYKYILEKIGMECVNVYSDTESHEWSAVKIGDAWYYVDVTQDDDDLVKWINHNFFLVTEAELLGRGTHSDGYITEKNVADMAFGKEFEGALWHGNWQEETPAVGEEGTEGEEGAEGGESTEGEEVAEGEGEESEPKYEWNESVVSSRIVFDGSDRYYCGFDDTAQKSVIYKCGADLANPEEFYVMDDGLWYIDPADAPHRRHIFGYLGGLGKYTYEAADGNDGKTCLYFNSPTAVYELELGAEEVQPVKVDGCEYTPGEGGYAYIFGLSTYDTLKYQTADVAVIDDSIGFDPKEEIQKTIACSVRLYEGTEQPELMDILTYPKDSKVNVPDYKQYGVVLKGWIKDLANNTLWDFANDTLTESVRLYADAEAAQMGEKPLQIHARSGQLLGTLDASITNFDDTYREAPTYMLAIYDNNTLVAVKTSTNGEFSIAPEDSIPYTETTAVKAYAWSSENEPYLDGAAVEIIKDLTGGEGEESGGEGETGGETGSGSEGEGEPGGETGGDSETGGDESNDEGETGDNEGGSETGNVEGEQI